MTKITITPDEATWTEFDSYPIAIRQEWLWEQLNEIKPYIKGNFAFEDALLTAEKFRDKKASEAKFKKACKTHSRIDIRNGIFYCAAGKDPYLPAHYCGTALQSILRFISFEIGSKEWDKAYKEAELVLRLSEPNIGTYELENACKVYANQIRATVYEQNFNELWSAAIEKLNEIAEQHNA